MTATTLILCLALAFAPQGLFLVIKQGGNVYLVPQGIIKTGLRSFSMADPNNPYRQQFEPSSCLPAKPTSGEEDLFESEPGLGAWP